MKTKENMDDEARKAAWALVTDPVEVLEELAEHSYLLTDDPYYRDLSNALWAMVHRVLEEVKK